MGRLARYAIQGEGSTAVQHADPGSPPEKPGQAYNFHDAPIYRMAIGEGFQETWEQVMRQRSPLAGPVDFDVMEEIDELMRRLPQISPDRHMGMLIDLISMEEYHLPTCGWATPTIPIASRRRATRTRYSTGRPCWR